MSLMKRIRGVPCMSMRPTHDSFVVENCDALGRQKVDDDAEGEPNIGQGEPREDQRENIVLE